MPGRRTRTNDLANELRKRHRDQLLGLLAARRELALAVGEDDVAVTRLDALLGLELGAGAETARPGRAACRRRESREVGQQAGTEADQGQGGREEGLLLPLPRRRAVAARRRGRHPRLHPRSTRERRADRRRGSARGRRLSRRATRFSFAGAARRAPAERERDSPFRRHFSVPLKSAFDAQDADARRRSSPSATARRRAATEDVDGLEVPAERVLAAHRRRMALLRRDAGAQAEHRHQQHEPGGGVRAPEVEEGPVLRRRRPARQLGLLEGRDVQGRRARPSPRRTSSRAPSSTRSATTAATTPPCRAPPTTPSIPTSPGWARARPPRSSPR